MQRLDVSCEVRPIYALLDIKGAMFKVSPASLQTFIDTPNCVLKDRVQYSTVHIPNVLFNL